MSADRITECPKCSDAEHARQEAALADYEARLRRAYGKVPPQEYENLLLTAPVFDDPPRTLREDYEIGVVGDTFYVSYTGKCWSCGFKIRYAHKQNVLEMGAEGGTA